MLERTGLVPESADPAAEPRERLRRGVVRAVVDMLGLLRRAMAEAWRDRIFGLAAEAGFWQLLSLPPLLLAVLGVIGYFGADLPSGTLIRLENDVVNAAARLLTPSAVDTLIRPAVHEILTDGRADVASIGFVLSLWAGSSAVATYVNTLSIAYDLQNRRSAVRSRLLALGLYLGFVGVFVVILPALVVGPASLARLGPTSVHRVLHTTIAILYWPVLIVVSVSLLASLYHLAVPVRTRWRRDVPGAVVALALWAGGSYALRIYVTVAFREHTTYGPLGAPIVVLLFMYVTALAVLFGAFLNAEIDKSLPRGRARGTGSERP